MLPVQVVYIVFQKYQLRTIIHHWFYLVTRWCRLFDRGMLYHALIVEVLGEGWDARVNEDACGTSRWVPGTDISISIDRFCCGDFSGVSKWLVVFFSFSLLYIVRAFLLLMVSKVSQYVAHFAVYNVLRHLLGTLNFTTTILEKIFID